MKKLVKFAALIMAVLATFACKKEVETTLSLVDSNDSAITVSAKGGTKTVGIKTNSKWSVASDASWLTLSPASGSAGTVEITATVAPNTTYDSRIANITVTAGAKTAKIVVTQLQTDAMNVPTTSFNVNYYGGTLQLPVESNINCTVNIPADCNWITSAGTKGLTTTTHLLNVAANDTYEYREATITVTAEGFEENVLVAQSGSVWAVNMTTAFERQANAMVSIAVLGGYIVVARGDGTAPKLLDKNTGEVKGALNVGDIAVCQVKNDDAGNLLLCNHTAYVDGAWDTSFKVWKMTSATATPVKIIEYGDYGPLGARLAVRGDVNKDAVVMSYYEGIADVTMANEVVYWTITNGVVGEKTAQVANNVFGLDSWGCPGYWNIYPNNAPAIGLMSASATGGILLSMYSDDYVQYLDNTFTASIMLNPQSDGSAWAYAYNGMDVRSANGHNYAAIVGSSFFTQWGLTAKLWVLDVTSPATIAAAGAAIDTTTALLAYPTTSSFIPKVDDVLADGIAASSDAVIETVNGGLNVYYIENNTSTIEAFHIALK